MMTAKKLTGLALATAAAGLFATAGIAPVMAADTGRSQGSLRRREFLQGPVGLPDRQQRLQGPEQLQGQGMDVHVQG